jgi:hypothetical protein
MLGYFTGQVNLMTAAAETAISKVDFDQNRVAVTSAPITINNLGNTDIVKVGLIFGAILALLLIGFLLYKRNNKKKITAPVIPVEEVTIKTTGLWSKNHSRSSDSIHHGDQVPPGF